MDSNLQMLEMVKWRQVAECVMDPTLAKHEWISCLKKLLLYLKKTKQYEEMPYWGPIAFDWTWTSSNRLWSAVVLQQKKKEKKAHLSYWASNNLSPFKDYLFKSFPRSTYKHETEIVKDKFFLCIIQLTASAVQSMCWWSCSYLERYTCFQW